MSDLQEKLGRIKANESFLEKVKRYIPGYDGYVNRDNSRELDTQIRNAISVKLDMNKPKVSNTINNLSRAKKLFETQDVDRISKKLETAIAKFKSAARGYSGAFDIVKIKDEKLSQLYDFDLALVTAVDNICTMFAELEKNSENGDITDVVKKLLLELDLLLVKFEEREVILRTFN